MAVLENIELGRQIENDYLGLRNGILDQVAVLQSRRNHLTWIDCRTAAHDSISAPPGLPPYRILLAFSGIRSALIGTDYNRRVEECAEAARCLLEAAGRTSSRAVLGNVTVDEYEAYKGRLRAEPARRAAHFFAEAGRVRRGVEAWKSGDLDGFGALMTASGESSIRLYQCGTPPLIDLYDALVESDGVYGARFSGAGFRGCCVALVEAASALSVADRVSSIYAARQPELARQAMTVICETANGAGDCRPSPPRTNRNAQRRLPDGENLMQPRTGPFPRSIAIAGAWGYIGRKFLDVALNRGMTTFVHDPGPMPGDLDPGRFIRIEDPLEFDRVDAEVFHLAVHPENRRLELLLDRERPPLILVEKPMAEPARPEVCRQVLEAVEGSRATVLYDFPEIYDPITARIVEYLGSYRDLQLTEFHVQRSKDREDPANPRNFKRMVTIQYQESVHCLAFVLHVLGAVHGSVRASLAGGLQIEGESAEYDPPNPEAYPYPVDGRCRFRGTIGGVRVEGLTDFKRGASWAKRRVIRGVGDGRPFEIEASYLEGKKALRIDGVDQVCDPSANSYESVLATIAEWALRYDRSGLMNGLFPNPTFAKLTYQLSAGLWKSCHIRERLAFRDAEDLESWDAGFAAEPARLAR